MKDLKIYSVDETPKPLLLRLAYTGRGDVMLIAVNNEGNQLTGGRLRFIPTHVGNTNSRPL